jgi:hypothetical protein
LKHYGPFTCAGSDRPNNCRLHTPGRHVSGRADFSRARPANASSPDRPCGSSIQGAARISLGFRSQAVGCGSPRRRSHAHLHGLRSSCGPSCAGACGDVRRHRHAHETDTPEVASLKRQVLRTFWSAEKVHDLANYFNEATARALLEGPGATIRISIYQFDQSRLRRLCHSTSDPNELRDALDRLGDPIPVGQGFDLKLPEGVAVRAEDRKEVLRGGRPWSRSLLAALTVLKDSTVGPPMAPRALIIFSPGAEGTTITPQDLVEQAVAAVANCLTAREAQFTEMRRKRRNKSPRSDLSVVVNPAL